MKSGIVMLRLLQLPDSIFFLIAHSWVTNLGASSIVTTVLRFIAGFLTMFYTACQLDFWIHGSNRCWFNIGGSKPHDPNPGGPNRSRSDQDGANTGGLNLGKIGDRMPFELLMEMLLAGLWYASLALGNLDDNTTLGSTIDAIHTPVVMAQVGLFIEVILFSMTLVLVALQTFGVGT